MSSEPRSDCLHLRRMESKVPATASSEFRANETMEIEFPAFSVRIDFHDAKQLTVRVVKGENAGFSDTIDYSAVPLHHGMVVLSWREHIGSTVVHVLDLINNSTHTFVTSARGEFLRITGKISRRVI